MAIKYKNQEEINAISTTTGGTYTRLSEAREALCGAFGVSGKGNKIQPFVTALRKEMAGANASINPESTRESNTWVEWYGYFISGPGAGKRMDQAKRLSNEFGTYA